MQKFVNVLLAMVRNDNKDGAIEVAGAEKCRFKLPSVVKIIEEKTWQG
jgi:hypothetical protein